MVSGVSSACYVCLAIARWSRRVYAEAGFGRDVVDGTVVMLYDDLRRLSFGRSRPETWRKSTFRVCNGPGAVVGALHAVGAIVARVREKATHQGLFLPVRSCDADAMGRPYIIWGSPRLRLVRRAPKSSVSTAPAAQVHALVVHSSEHRSWARSL